MPLDENASRKVMVEIGQRLYQRGLLVGEDGNFSVKIADNEILITPTGVCKGYLEPEQIPKVDLEGRMLSGRVKPARDIRMHLAVYQCRPDVRALVHAHPPVATGFAIAGVPIKITSPEVIFSLRNIGLTEYAAPTTDQVPKVVRKKLSETPDCDALLLASHGALTMGTDLHAAFYKMETLEMYLKATLVARLLGNENTLNERQINELKELMKKGPAASEVGNGEAFNQREFQQGGSPPGINRNQIAELVKAVVFEVLKQMEDGKSGR
ncbi:MAG: class II aldolase/adducin family protein [Bacillota bacterium]